MSEKRAQVSSVRETANDSPAAGAPKVTADESGVEVEREDITQIRRPFDPEKIKVRTTSILVDLLVSRIRHQEIDLAPDFQRLAGIWDNTRKSRLIESLLLRIPIPVFYVAADANDIWSVVDGVQRISTVYDYVTKQFRLSNLEYLHKLKNAAYNELPRQMQRRIDETQFVINVIEPGTPREVMFNIFRRINTGGKPLNGQEIRHALNPGPVRNYLKELAETEEFLNATDGSINKMRMSDRECVLRFLAFYMESWEEYRSSDLDGFLSSAMNAINLMDDASRLELALAFKKAMRAAFDIFRTDAFRKRYNEDDYRKPINRPLFEAWGVELAKRTTNELKTLVTCRELLVERFIESMNEDSEFEEAISYATGDPSRVRKRFQKVKELIGITLL